MTQRQAYPTRETTREPTPKSDAFARFAKALREIGPTLGKSATNPFFKSKYIPLPELLLIVVPKLNENGLLLHFPNGVPSQPGQILVVASVCDEETGVEVARSEVGMPLIADPQKNTMNYTYGRRTATTCVLGIAEKDDDGNSAAKKDTPKRASAGATGGQKVW